LISWEAARQPRQGARISTSTVTYVLGTGWIIGEDHPHSPVIRELEALRRAEPAPPLPRAHDRHGIERAKRLVVHR
jgi:hypothetical protein